MFSTIFVDVGSEKVQKSADVIQGWSLWEYLTDLSKNIRYLRLFSTINFIPDEIFETFINCHSFWNF